MSIECQANQVAKMCMALGIQRQVQEGQNPVFSHMPVSLYPYQLSQEIYLKLKKAHTAWAKLILAVSKDKQLVNKVFQSAAKNDQFVRRFLELYNRHLQNQKFGVCCLRVDYMGDQKPQIVEFNTIAVGFNGISDLVQKLTSMKKLHRTQNTQTYYPKNENVVTLFNSVESIIKLQDLKGIILILAHGKNQNSYNFGDLMAFQFQALHRGYKVKKVSIDQFYQQYSIRENNSLYIQNEKVSVVYFRTGYSPNQYTSQNHWKVRQQIQRANVISIPSISMQLVNFKRMQVQLSKIQVLRKYLSNQEAQLIKSLNGEFYDFQDQSQIDKIIDLARNGNYVLKPNRQGGGNNYFGSDVIQVLTKLKQKPQELKNYILTSRINSQCQSNVFLIDFRHQAIKETTCQFSTFGTFSYKQNQMIFNSFGGNLARIKSAQQNQGGITIGKGVIGGICIKKIHEFK